MSETSAPGTFFLMDAEGHILWYNVPTLALAEHYLTELGDAAERDGVAVYESGEGGAFQAVDPRREP